MHNVFVTPITYAKYLLSNYRRSTFGFERAGVSTKEDQASQTVLVIDEDGQKGVAAERAGILETATHEFEQAHASLTTLLIDYKRHM
ncbi:uncharacterized protein [Pleurodeles waltl]